MNNKSQKMRETERHRERNKSNKKQVISNKKKRRKQTI